MESQSLSMPKWHKKPNEKADEYHGPANLIFQWRCALNIFHLLLPFIHAHLQFKQFAEALGLRAADGDFGLLFVAHLEHVAGLEPGHHFFDVLNVHQNRAISTPERIGFERRI